MMFSSYWAWNKCWNERIMTDVYLLRLLSSLQSGGLADSLFFFFFMFLDPSSVILFNGKCLHCQ